MHIRRCGSNKTTINDFEDNSSNIYAATDKRCIKIYCPEKWNNVNNLLTKASDG
jgi:hypothetical protein